VTARRRRAAALLGLALVLGGLAASDVARREAAAEAQLAPLVDVVVAHGDLAPGTRLKERHLAVRRMPERYAPPGAAAEPAELVGQKVAIAVPAGGPLAAGQFALPEAPEGAAGIEKGERAADVVAAGSPELVRPGARVDVVVTRSGDHADGGTRLALEDVEVLASAPAPDPGGDGAGAGIPRVAATLRVRLRQAVYLAAAQSFARELRLLPRAPGDRRRGGELAVGASLR
jgi:pilus assembly protein CpaB